MAYRTELLQFKVTPKEKENIQKKAEKEELTVSEFIRNKVLKK